MAAYYMPMIFLFCFLVLGSCKSRYRTSNPVTDSTTVDQRYIEQVNRVKKGKAIDYYQLRLDYARSSYYEPYETYASKEMNQAFRLENYREAITYAQKTLAKRFVDFEAHVICGRSYLELGDSVKAGYHEKIAFGLLESILESGNGHGIGDSAYVVILVPEEYAVLSFFGLRLATQALIERNEHSYDQMVVEDIDQGKIDTVYFNIDLPIRWWKKKIGD